MKSQENQSIESLEWDYPLVPSGKHTNNYGKSPFFMGKSTISMVIFNGKLLNYRKVTQPQQMVKPSLWKQSNVIIRGRQNTSTNCQGRPNLLRFQLRSRGTLLRSRAKHCASWKKFEIWWLPLQIHRKSIKKTHKYQYYIFLFHELLKQPVNQWHHDDIMGKPSLSHCQGSAIEASKDRPAMWGTRSWMDPHFLCWISWIPTRFNGFI